jgi:hypothetical protein
LLLVAVVVGCSGSDPVGLPVVDPEDCRGFNRPTPTTPVPGSGDAEGEGGEAPASDVEHVEDALRAAFDCRYGGVSLGPDGRLTVSLVDAAPEDLAEIASIVASTDGDDEYTSVTVVAVPVGEYALAQIKDVTTREALELIGTDTPWSVYPDPMRGIVVVEVPLELNDRRDAIRSDIAERTGAPEEWFLVTASSTVGLGETGIAGSPVTWELDPAFPAPTAESTEIHVLATEVACSGGTDMGDRLRDAVIVVGEEEIRITLEADPLQGAQECPDNPSQPTVIPLPEPLGDRRLVDGSP